MWETLPKLFINEVSSAMGSGNQKTGNNIKKQGKSGIEKVWRPPSQQRVQQPRRGRGCPAIHVKRNHRHEFREVELLKRPASALPPPKMNLQLWWRLGHCGQCP